MSRDTTEQLADSCDKVNDDSTKIETYSSSDASSFTTSEKVPLRIVWRNVILFVYLHLATLYGAYLMFTSAMWQTNVFAAVSAILSNLGVTAGVHRLWCHRSYKAKLPLRIFLASLYTLSFQSDIYNWCRDHRVHHKFSDTDADPYNSTRGLFFSHSGWLLCRKHPDVTEKGKSVALTDVLADPIVRFHRKYYLRLSVLCCLILPTIIPMYVWNETFKNAFLAAIARLCLSLHQAWLVNSVAHKWGSRPYNLTINPRDNVLTALISIGEGFHNYHHTFPYDYANSEYGIKYNLSTAFIDLMAWLGLAYDRKTASRESIKARKVRTGEGSLVKNAS